jgi:hypothetical protein
MEEVEYETAELAAEKGFDKPTIGWYWIDKKSEYCNKSMEHPFTGLNWNRERFPKRVSAPTKTQLKKWLREVHNIDVDIHRDIEIHYQDETRWCGKVSNFNNIKEVKLPIAMIKHPEHYHLNDFKSYEEAMEAGLKRALKIIE